MFTKISGKFQGHCLLTSFIKNTHGRRVLIFTFNPQDARSDYIDVNIYSSIMSLLIHRS